MSLGVIRPEPMLLDTQAIYWLQSRLAYLILTSCIQKKHLLLEAIIAALVLPRTYRASFVGIVRLGYLRERGG
jgi:hypothetical protein